MSASVLRYRKLVTTDLANQAVNLAESGTMGHRVQLPMSVDDMNSFFVWDRPAGSDRAVGHFVATTPTGLKFDDIMISCLSRVFTDIDGVTNGLNFSSAVLDANTDGRVRKDGNVSANDIVMAYLLYKCYGSSAAPTASVIYNLEDAHQMLSNGGLTLAIHNSLATEEALSNSAGVDKGAVDAMFRDLLAADPMRFFDATGKQIAGLFETNADSDSTGSWGFVENDKIEMRVQFNFTNAVTRRGVQDPSQAMTSSANPEDVDTVVIPAGSKFVVRLQIVATDTPSGAAAKANASANAISSALSAQVASTKKAADNAAAAQRAATDAMNAAAAQTAAANARYQKAVNDAAAQATAVSNSQAALQAAQAALAQAIATGSTQSDIQNQRAAAVAAQAAAQNAQAISAAAQADIQNAKNAQDAAAASLAAAQTATATAAANVAKANAAAAAAALAASNDAATKASTAKAAADAASDPLTKTLTDAEKKILDPQTLITAAAEANAKTDARVLAKTASDKAQAAADLAAQKQDADAKALADAIALGETLTTIQMLRAAAVTSFRDRANADAASAANHQNFLNAARAELSAQQLSAKASSDACVLKESIARADVNAKERIYVAANAANTAAQAANTAAQTAATNAQNSLDAAIAAGAVFVELQTKRAAALDTRTAANTAKDAADKALAALVDADRQKALAVDAATAAAAARNEDLIASASKEALIRNSTLASENYQKAKVYLANANARAQAFNESQMNRNDAKQSLDVAMAAYVVARDALDAGVTAGKTVPEIVALRTQAQAASDRQTQAQAIFNAAVTTFEAAERALKFRVLLDANGNPRVDGSGNLVLDNSGTIWDASANAILIAAAQNNLASITNAEANSLVLNYLNAQKVSDVAASDAAKARNVSEAAKRSLEAGVLGGLTLGQLTALRSEAVDAASKEAKAKAAANAAATAALNSLGRLLTPGPNYASAVSILNSMRILQGQADNAARNNELAAALNRAYAEDTDAQKALVTAQYAQYVADKALADAVIGGGSLEAIRGLQASAAIAAQMTSEADQKAFYTNRTLVQQTAWAAQSAAFDTPGGPFAETYSTDASGVLVLTAAKVAAAAAAESARCNALVRQYMLLLTKADEASTETYKVQADFDLAKSALDTSITQGADLAGIQSLRAQLEVVTNKLSALKAAENLAKAAKDSSKATLLARDPSGNYINAAAVTILNNAVIEQGNAIDRAAANKQVDDYRAAFEKYQHTLSELKAATSAVQLASKSLNTAITAGADVTAIQGLRLSLEQARSAESIALAARDRAKEATDDLQVAIETGVRDVSGVFTPRSRIAMDLLIQARVAQEAAVASAESNARARIYFKAKDDESKANVLLANAHASYDTAARLLDQAITGGSTLNEIQALRLAAQTAGDVLAVAQSSASAASAASAIAKENVTADPNALAILNNLQLYQANKASFAKANSLIDAWHAAVKVEATAQRDYNLAELAQNIAAKALDTSIANGAGITEIQSLRDTSVEATQIAARAMATLNLKKAEALKARTDAAEDPLATVILDSAAQFDKKAVAAATVNSAKLTLAAAEQALLAANAQAAADAARSDAANRALSYAILPYDPSGNNITASPVGGKTVQEIVDLRANANLLAQVAAASKNNADAIAADVIGKQVLKSAAEARWAAIPYPQLTSTQSYIMTTVSLNETKVVKDASGQHIYIDSNVLVRAIRGANIAGIVYDPVDLVGKRILGLGVKATDAGVPVDTLITGAVVVPSLPTGLYPTAVKITVNRDVEVGDGNFYLVGGEIELNDFIM